jgi:hypothetical protein
VPTFVAQIIHYVAVALDDICGVDNYDIFVEELTRDNTVRKLD